MGLSRTTSVTLRGSRCFWGRPSETMQLERCLSSPSTETDSDNKTNNSQCRPWVHSLFFPSCTHINIHQVSNLLIFLSFLLLSDKYLSSLKSVRFSFLFFGFFVGNHKYSSGLKTTHLSFLLLALIYIFIGPCPQHCKKHWISSDTLSKELKFYNLLNPLLLTICVYLLEAVYLTTVNSVIPLGLSSMRYGSLSACVAGWSWALRRSSWDTALWRLLRRL